MQFHDSHPKILVSVLAAVALFASVSAHATLIGDQVNITLASPGDGIDLSDAVTVGPGNEIQTGDSTNIGGSGTPLLSEEFLDIQASRIVLQLESGVEDGGNLLTGYSPGAYWLIADLDFAGASIIGFELFLFDIISTSFDVNDIIFSGNDTFQIFISDLFFVNGVTDIDTGRIELQLLTDSTPPPPVPEPGTLALLGFGLVALAGTRRRRPR